ncbi:MAG: hypothetical protein WCA82_06405 [Jiangellales bacterium]
MSQHAHEADSIGRSRLTILRSILLSPAALGIATGIVVGALTGQWWAIGPLVGVFYGLSALVRRTQQP